MSKPLNKTAKRYTSNNEQKLDNLLTSHANACRAKNTVRAEALMVEIEAVRAEIAANQARAAKRAEAQREASRAKWYEEQMALAKAGIRK